MNPLGPAVLTIGVFDGVHRGHAAVLAEARGLASGRARVVVMTFDPHPAQVVGGAEPQQLVSLQDRVARLRTAGADEVRVLRFRPEVAALTAQEFFARFVFPFADLQGLVVGYDFALGQGRRGNQDALKDLGRSRGFPVHAVGPLESGGAPVSSSRIRELVVAGRVAEAGELLGAAVRLEGVVGHGAGRGAGIGFPTANLEPVPGRVVPGDGVYAVWVSAGSSWLPGVVNVGTRPTFGGGERAVEAHILDPVGDLRGRRLTVEFVRRLRGERKFNDVKELQDAIRSDVASTRALLQEPRPADNPA